MRSVTCQSSPAAATYSLQLVNACYERGAMILTSNRGFAEWGDLFGHPVVAAALLDRLLYHAIVIQIEGASYRLRQHVDLIPEIPASDRWPASLPHHVDTVACQKINRCSPQPPDWHHR